MRFAQLLRKSSNIQGKTHSASVFFRRHVSATSAASASLWHHVHLARGLEEYGEASSSRFACVSTLQKCEEGTQRKRLDAIAKTMVYRLTSKSYRLIVCFSVFVQCQENCIDNMVMRQGYLNQGEIP